MRERHTEVIKKRLIWQRSRDENRLASLFGQFHAQHGHGHIVAVLMLIEPKTMKNTIPMQLQHLSSNTCVPLLGLVRLRGSAGFWSKI